MPATKQSELASPFSKYPSDIQIKIKTVEGKDVWVPFTGASYDVTKEMTAEHYSGKRHAWNITEGNIDFRERLKRDGWSRGCRKTGRIRDIQRETPESGSISCTTF